MCSLPYSFGACHTRNCTLHTADSLRSRRYSSTHVSTATPLICPPRQALVHTHAAQSTFPKVMLLVSCKRSPALFVQYSASAAAVEHDDRKQEIRTQSSIIRQHGLDWESFVAYKSRSRSFPPRGVFCAFHPPRRLGLLISQLWFGPA